MWRQWPFLQHTTLSLSLLLVCLHVSNSRKKAVLLRIYSTSYMCYPLPWYKLNKKVTTSSFPWLHWSFCYQHKQNFLPLLLLLLIVKNNYLIIKTQKQASFLRHHNRLLRSKKGNSFSGRAAHVCYLYITFWKCTTQYYLLLVYFCVLTSYMQHKHFSV